LKQALPKDLKKVKKGIVIVLFVFQCISCEHNVSAAVAKTLDADMEILTKAEEKARVSGGGLVTRLLESVC